MIRCQGVEVLLTDLMFPTGKLLHMELLGDQGLPVLGFTTNFEHLTACIYPRAHTHTHTKATQAKILENPVSSDQKPQSWHKKGQGEGMNRPLPCELEDIHENWLFQGTFGFISWESFSFDTSPARWTWWFCPGCISSYRHLVTVKLCWKKPPHILQHVANIFFDVSACTTLSYIYIYIGLLIVLHIKAWCSSHCFGNWACLQWVLTELPSIRTAILALSWPWHLIQTILSLKMVIQVWPPCLRGICKSQSVWSKSSLQLTIISATLLTSLLDAPVGSNFTLSDSQGTCKPTKEPFKNSWKFWNQGKPTHTHTHTHTQKQDPAEPFSPASSWESPSAVPQ